MALYPPHAMVSEPDTLQHNAYIKFNQQHVAADCYSLSLTSVVEQQLLEVPSASTGFSVRWVEGGSVAGACYALHAAGR